MTVYHSSTTERMPKVVPPRRSVGTKGHPTYMSSSLRKLIFNKIKSGLLRANEKDARKNPAIVDAAIEAIKK